MRGTFMLLAITSILAGSFLACGAEDACQLPQQEAPYPASGVHLLNETGATWAGDPPTSGPHRAFRPSGGIHREPIPRLDQVAFLEAGGVILHYDSGLASNQLVKLHTLAGPEVAVAPNPSLGPEYPVVATAWTWRLRCQLVDSETLDRFVVRRVGTGGLNH
ncbi:MAG: DUF3105 domain-containing protein [Acidimicrobiales bacterium]|jgi:hypothetical protein|nr:DUF3105 domain-containing protein [Acidimicrobiales bacterium]